MSCSLAEALFELFLDGELAAVQSERLIAHVDRCPTCRGVLEELRVVDALLLGPRRIDLAPNFSFAVMAEARALPPPAPYRAPIRAYLVSYLAAAWMLAGAAALFAPQTMRAVGAATLGLMRGAADAVSALVAVAGRSFGHDGSVLTAVLGALLTFDVALVAGFGFALKYVQPRLVERLRS
jgi:predicted anti-sigma-YlaC factor YlaD